MPPSGQPSPGNTPTNRRSFSDLGRVPTIHDRRGSASRCHRRDEVVCRAMVEIHTDTAPPRAASVVARVPGGRPGAYGNAGRPGSGWRARMGSGGPQPRCTHGSLEARGPRRCGVTAGRAGQRALLPVYRDPTSRRPMLSRSSPRRARKRASFASNHARAALPRRAFSSSGRRTNAVTAASKAPGST